MHQHVPSASALPHANETPQRAQTSFRNGSEAEGIIGALSGGIAGKINHAWMTALRRPEIAIIARSLAFSSIAVRHGRGRCRSLL